MRHKTEIPCDCPMVSYALNDPNSGLTLEGNRFMMSKGEGSWYAVYHCFGCGGLLPDGSKPIWYPRLSEEETARLEQIADGISSAEEAIERLGPPDYDSDNETPIGDGTPSTATFWRNIEYYNLSKDGQIEFYFPPEKVADQQPTGQRRFSRIMLKHVAPRHIESE